ncbi:uncharacterized protein LOC132184045 [Corylus avellana]|uniref:uncharacterized protein LOC132184045 n=1 Tax=Corylus avellana TaxID=13451 RepID=UPI00286D2328|nr:uncharacterized protein LOC132184045 [Corylus avellana]
MTEVLIEIRRGPNFKWPTRMKGLASKRDHTKFCQYHNEVSHLIKECVSLRQEIESFIRNGKLVRFLADERDRGRDHQQPLPLEGNREAVGGRDQRPRHGNGSRDDRYVDPAHNQQAKPRNDRDACPPPQNPNVVGEILTISGGIAGGGESNSARRAHARRVQTEEVLFLEGFAKTLKQEPMVLSFTEEDAKGVMMPHDDTLVVTVTVANHLLHRILIKNGSSADILYWPVFKQMGIDRSRITPFGSPLVGFAGGQVQPIRIISLPVTAGTAPKQSTVMVVFLVVNRPFAYNAIISQPALNKLKAVTSTYHLKTKFPIEEGIREVKGGQTTARKCYITSLKKPSEVTPLTVSTVGSRK